MRPHNTDFRINKLQYRLNMVAFCFSRKPYDQFGEAIRTIGFCLMRNLNHLLVGNVIPFNIFKDFWIRGLHCCAQKRTLHNGSRLKDLILFVLTCDSLEIFWPTMFFLVFGYFPADINIILIHPKIQISQH